VSAGRLASAAVGTVPGASFDTSPSLSQLAGDDAQARAAYQHALELYPRNWAARVNLAVTEARLAGSYRISITILEDALAAMRAEGAVQ
jgi:Flp pilus assembly protein TadD